MPIVAAGLAVALLSCLPLVWTLVNRPLVGTALVLVIFVLDTAAVGLPGLSVGLFLYPQDIVFVSLFCGAIVRRLVRPRITWPEMLLLGLLGLALVSFARGAGAYGIRAAGVEFRTFFYFLTGALYVSAFKPTDERRQRLYQQMVAAAYALMAIAVFRWAAEILGLGIATDWADAASGSRFRVLNASQAFFLATGLMIVLYRTLRGETSLRWRILGIMSVPALLLLQHRSVWAAFLAGAAVIFFAVRGTKLKVLLWASSVALLVFALAIATRTAQPEDLVASVTESAQSTNTLDWRIEGWQALLGREGISIMGNVFGSGYVRYVRGERIEASPHNFFLQTYLRLGLAGLLVTVWLYAVLLRRNIWRPQQIADYPAESGLLAAMLVMQLVYFLPYAPGIDQGILLGVAIGVFGTEPRPIISRNSTGALFWQTAGNGQV